jgi:hypothetical protein
MARQNDIAIGQDLLNVPMGDMIKQMAFAIADAQFELDESSIRVAELMSGNMVVRDADGNILFFNPADATQSTTDPTLQSTWLPRYIDTRVQFGTTVNQAVSIGTNNTTIGGTSVGQVLPQVTITVADVTDFPTIGGILIVTTDTGSHTVTYTGVDTVNKAFTGCRGGTGKMSTGDSVVSAVRLPDVPNMVSMFELGFSPTFYQFVDTIIEVKIAIKITREQSFELKGSLDVNYTSKRGNEKKGKSSSVTVTAHVDATYSSKYSYSAEGSSLLRTKLAPVPPPAVFEERVRALFAVPTTP